MIKVEQVYKSFGDLQVLKGIDLEVNRGEIVSVVGPSGAGKTTLLMIMGTLEKADAGRILIDNNDLSRFGEKRRPTSATGTSGLFFSFTSYCRSSLHWRT